jgi:hypothetical protein
VLQLSRCCQAFSGPKMDYWNGPHTLFPWSDFELLLVVSRNNLLYGDEDFRILKICKNVTRALKALPQQEFQNCCSIVGLSA